MPWFWIVEVSLYSVSSTERDVSEGGLQRHKKQHVNKKKNPNPNKHTYAYSFIPVLNNAIQVSKYNDLSVFSSVFRRECKGLERLNFAQVSLSQVNICLLLNNESSLFLISRAGGQLEFPSWLLGHCFLSLLLFILHGTISLAKKWNRYYLG